MALKHQWDVDDPAFLLVLSTGDMRVLMEKFPAKFEALMNRVFKQGEERWKLLTARLISAVEASEQAALAVGNDIELINIGFGNSVAAERIVSIISPESAPIKRLITEARQRGQLVDATYGRRTRSVMIITERVRRALFYSA